MTQTQKLLAASEQPLTDVALDTGISVDWLSRFRCGTIRDPGVNRVEILYTYLSGDVLTLGRFKL